MRAVAVVAALFLWLSCAAASGLVDHPIAGTAVQYLDGQWDLSNKAGINIKATVPGDIITDLQKAGKVGDPIYEDNWLTDSHVWSSTQWEYSLIFDVGTNFTSATEVYLSFDGIKMGASIFVNGRLVGTASDQFLRYTFAIKTILKAKNNLLHVSFAKNFGEDIDCQGRFMACTGGWDWAPYSNTRDQHGAFTLSFGIWKSVYLTAVSSVGISHIVPHTYWKGEYPTSPLGARGNNFDVQVKTFFITPVAVSGTLTVKGEWGQSVSQKVTVPVGESSFAVTLAANDVDLWWPNGLGKQTLYEVNVTFTPNQGPAVNDERYIGFRVFALVTADDSDPSKLKGKNGSGNLLMRYRVNGANIWARGGNMIPMESFEGRANAEAFRRLVDTAKAGGFNLFRIWGGGIFYYDVFYEECDKQGIMMYHDMMYAQQHHSPNNSPTQSRELRYNVRRLSHHPSIAMWDGCNECGGAGIYNTFVVTTVMQEDTSRPIWPSCPACGYDSGVDMLYGLPNGQPLELKKSCNTVETHGPYQHGTGFKTVNDPDGKLVVFPPNIPPDLHEHAKTGFTVPGIFASEFGCVGMSSFESMSVTLKSDNWGLHSAPMFQRNYPCDNIIDVYFGKQDFSKTGPDAFKRQLYQCLLGQALEMKSDIEVRRSTNEFGTAIWQLNEIWPTGGWGSIEYGTPVSGQVIGGRWKPLHHFLSDFLYKDLIVSCSSTSSPDCYVKNDNPMHGWVGNVILSLFRFSDGMVSQVRSLAVRLAPGAGSIFRFCLLVGGNGDCATWQEVLKVGDCQSEGDCMLLTSLEGTGIHNFELLTSPYLLKLPAPVITIKVDSSSGAVTLVSNESALFVTLTTLAQGRFEMNSFLLRAGIETKVEFVWFGPVDVPLLEKSLRVEHLQMYL